MNETPQEDHLNLDKPGSKRDAKASAAETHQDSKSGNQPEYRLVPVQAWESSSHGYNSYNPDDEIDLVELLKTLWEERKTILSFTLAGALIGILIGFLSPKMYTVTATLLPEYKSESTGGASSILRQFGGLAGISAAPSATESLSPQLYPDIVKTLPFQLQLMQQEFYIPEVDSMATLYTYLTEIKEEDGLTTLKSYTIGLPGKAIGMLAGLFSGNHDDAENTDIALSNNLSADILNLNNTERGVAGYLNENITVSIESSGVITLNVNLPDPTLAASVGQYVITQLTTYLTEFRTEKVKRDLAFTENRLQEAKARYEDAGLALSEFQESNQGTATARMRKGEQFLQSEYEIAFGIYNTVSQQFEQQRLKVQEQTPVFRFLQPINLPKTPSSPNKSLLAILSTFVAGFLSLIIVFVKRSNLVHAFKES